MPGQEREGVGVRLRRTQVGHLEEIQSLDFSERFYSAIGRFIESFSLMEFALKFTTADAINLHDYREQVMSHDFAMLCTMAQKILTTKMNKSEARELKDHISKCRELNDHRVRIVHGMWRPRTGRLKGVLIHTSRQKLEPMEYYKRADEIARLADDAMNLENDWYRFSAIVNPTTKRSPR
jgi:hypothetical protein